MRIPISDDELVVYSTYLNLDKTTYAYVTRCNTTFYIDFGYKKDLYNWKGPIKYKEFKKLFPYNISANVHQDLKTK